MDWIEVAIFTTSEAIESISGFLYQLDITDLIIQDHADIADFLEKNDKSWDYVDDEIVKNCNDEACVKFYLSDDTIGKEKIELVTKGILQLEALEEEINLGRLEIKLTNVSEDDWANNWKQYYKPLRIGEKIIIKPTWEVYEPLEGDLVIEMDPGMAFGTGTHETTSMCIELLQKHVQTGDIVLDIGCGSGILGITGAMLGAKEVVGVDFDEVAVEVAIKNVQTNKLEDRVEIRCGDLMSVVSEKANVIVANIVADVIIKLTDSVPKFSLQNGIFIASGIIKERKEEVKAALLKGHFEILEVVQNGEWVAIASRMRV